jgi:predicted branched-subunit amino acid permease
VPETHAPPSQRGEFLAGCRDMAPVLVGTVPFGFVAGVAAVGAGMTPLQGIALSFSAFSGIAQLVVAQLIAAQSPFVVTLGAALVVSLRFLMYSAALSPHLAHLQLRWRVPLAYLMTDQGFAMGVHIYGLPGDRSLRHFRVLGSGLTLYVVWQAAVIAGAVAGAQVPVEWSLDFVVTLTFLALLGPALRTRADIAAAAVAGAVVLVAAGLPYKLSLVVASSAGIAAGFLLEWRHHNPDKRAGRQK